MSDVLSQSEIDALLAAMAAGEATENDSKDDSVSESNTSSAVLENSLKFSESDINMLEYIHKKYVNIMNSHVFKNLNAKINMESVQEIRYEEFMHSIPSPDIVSIFRLNPLEGELLLEINPDIVYKLAEFFLEKSESQKNNLSEISEKDKSMFLKITRKFIDCLEKAWNNVLNAKCEIKYLETDPGKIKIANNDESVVLVSFSIVIDNVNKCFNICIPYLSIEKYLNKLEVKDTASEFELNNDFGSTNLNIKVVLDNIQLTLGELIDWEKGTIVETNKKYKNKVNILVEEKHCFNGEVGSIRNRKAVKIVDCLDKDV